MFMLDIVAGPHHKHRIRVLGILVYFVKMLITRLNFPSRKLLSCALCNDLQLKIGLLKV